MDEKMKAYYGIDVPSAFRLESGNLVPNNSPREPEPIVFSDVEAVPIDEPLYTEAEAKKERDEIEEWSLKREMIDLVKRGHYREAYSLHCDTEVSIANHPDFLELLENIIKKALQKGQADGRYFRLLYLLGDYFDIGIVPNLDKFIRLVFDTYREYRLPHDGEKPLKKLARLFGNQIDLNYYEEEW